MPNIPTPKSSIQPLKTIVSSIKQTQVFKGIKTLAGGMAQEHVIEVVDKSGDISQLLPFQFHCNTCAYEGKAKNYDEALYLAQRHVGL